MSVQRRTCRLEFRAEGDADDSALAVSGYGSTFETPDRHDSYGTIFNRHAFDEWIEAHGPQGDDTIPLLWQHADPFGMPRTLSTDETGLMVRGHAIDTTENAERMKYVRGRVVRGLSVGFEPLEYAVREERTLWGDAVVEFLKVRLFEVSLVTIPSNPYAHLLSCDPSRISWRRLESGAWAPYVRTEADGPLSRLRDALVAAGATISDALYLIDSRAVSVDADALSLVTDPRADLDVEIQRLIDKAAQIAAATE